MASGAPNELCEISQYNKIIRFHNTIMEGAHPRFRNIPCFEHFRRPSINSEAFDSPAPSLSPDGLSADFPLSAITATNSNIGGGMSKRTPPFKQCTPTVPFLFNAPKQPRSTTNSVSLRSSPFPPAVQSATAPLLFSADNLPESATSLTLSAKGAGPTKSNSVTLSTCPIVPTRLSTLPPRSFHPAHGFLSLKNAASRNAWLTVGTPTRPRSMVPPKPMKPLPKPPITNGPGPRPIPAAPIGAPSEPRGVVANTATATRALVKKEDSKGEKADRKWREEWQKAENRLKELKINIDFKHNYYKDIGVDPHVGLDSMWRGFRSKEQNYSPNSRRGAELRRASDPAVVKKVQSDWQRVSMAYKILTNDLLRSYYDAERLIVEEKRLPRRIRARREARLLDEAKKNSANEGAGEVRNENARERHQENDSGRRVLSGRVEKRTSKEAGIDPRASGALWSEIERSSREWNRKDREGKERLSELAYERAG